MLVRLSHIRNSSLTRAIYITSLFFIFSYIAFDLLDLDGSNLSSYAAPSRPFSIVAVVPSDADLSYSSDHGEQGLAVATLIVHTLAEYTRLYMTRLADSSLFASPRAHGYRIGLARDDLPD